MIDDATATSPVTIADEFESYKRLYSEYIEQEIILSESHLLTPRYLHLHESEIKHAGEYKLQRYVKSFINNLENLRECFHSAVFCYSHEEDSGCIPKECKREDFFYYQTELPAGRLLLESDIKPSQGDLTQRPPIMKIGNQILQVIKQYDIVQPYILQEVDGKVKCEHAILLSPKESDIQNLINSFTNGAGYQFSIYAYRLTDQARLSKTIGAAELLYLEHAFIMHILNWNFGLRSTHQMRAYVEDGILGTVKAWKEVRTKMDGLLGDFYIMSGTTSQVESYNVLPIYPEALERLFNEGLMHDLSEFEIGKFEDFLRRAYKPGPADSSLLTRFVKKCGAEKCLEDYKRDGDSVQLTSWAKGIWFATKLLTRRLEVGKRPEGLGPDQISLALLYGLALSDSWTPYTLRFNYRSGDGEQAPINPQMFLIRAGLENGGDSPWGPHSWKVSTGEDSKVMKIDWESPKDQSDPMLQAFIRSGLLRSQEHLPSNSGLTVPGCSLKPHLLNELLSSLMGVVRGLSGSSVPVDGLRLQEITVRYDLVTAGDSWDSELTIEMSCRGNVGNVLDLGETGILSKHLTNLANCFGQARLLQRPKEAPPGVYVKSFALGSADDASEGSATQLIVVLQSDNRKQWSA